MASAYPPSGQPLPPEYPPTQYPTTDYPPRMERPVADTTQVMHLPEVAPRPETRAAYTLLRVGFTLLPIIAGLDKFFHYLVNWDQYLSPTYAAILGGSPHTIMLGVGVVEIIAGLIVAVAPMIGGFIVMLWLWGIIANLCLIPGYFDVALRDFGLSLAALALGLLASGMRVPTVRTARAQL